MTGNNLQNPRNAWFPLAIIGGLVVLTAWFGQLGQMPILGDKGGGGHDPDYFVEDFSATAFDIAGKPRYHLDAVRMTHYMDDDSTTLDAPRFAREGGDKARVLIRSLRGLVSSNGENVYFFGDVRMMQERIKGGLPMELSTEYLQVTPDADFIQTDKPVVLKEGRSELHGAAMVADGRQRTLELKGRVKGVYDTHH